MNAELRHNECMNIAKVIFGDIGKDENINVSLNKIQLFHALTINNEKERIAKMLDDQGWTYGAALVRGGE